MLLRNIRRLCGERSVSIAKLERETGIGNGTVARWDISSPSIDKVQRVAEYFGVTVDELLKKQGGMYMAQKNATPTKEQKAVMEKRGLKSAFWVVIRETPHSLIVKQRITGEFRVIEK